MKAKGKIQLVEVGLRDGLQNESVHLSVEDRFAAALQLAKAGVRHIELGAFVSPQWVPQMAGSRELFAMAQKHIHENPKSDLAKCTLSALVPNQRGMDDALNSGVKHIAIFGSASETFSQKNINCSIDESFERFESIMKLAKKNRVKVRGYLSMCFGCPFEGEISETKVVQLAKRFAKIGVYEVSIGDTIGVADPEQVRRLVKKLKAAIGVKRLAMHFHDTRGTALANVSAAIDLGIRTFDSSLGGLGGCPYAPAATGNVATEDVVYMVERMGYKTGIDLSQLFPINQHLGLLVGHELPSKVSRAGLPK